MWFIPLVGFLFAVSVAASSSDSGVYENNGHVKIPVAAGPTFLDAVLLRYPGGTPTRDTDAARMHRGLHPLPPVRRSLKQWRPHRPHPAHVPCVPIPTQGVIAISSTADGSLKGYLASQFNIQRSYTLTTDLTTAQTFTLPSASPYNIPIDISTDNSPDMSRPLLGAIGGSSGFYLQPGQLGTAYLAGVGHINANSPPSTTVGTSMQLIGYNGSSESQIWMLSCNLDISAQWTNSDGSQPVTTFFYDPQVDYLGLTSDLAVLDSFFDESALAVTFTFVPIP